MSGASSAGLRSGLSPQSAIASTGNSAVLVPPYGAAHFAIVATVTGLTGTSITFEVQWSFDGTNFFSADNGAGAATQKDTFTAIVGAKVVVKEVTAKAPYYRIAWTGTYSSASFSFGDVPITANSVGPVGLEQGAAALAPPVVGAVGSTTLVATFVQGTTTTYSAIKSSPAGASRLAVLLKATANTWTTGVFELLWSYDGATLIHSDPADTFTTFAGAASVIKETAVKAPFYALAIISGTPGSATFTADVVATAL